ncbi:hypothetical protein [Tissierella praeacuta]|uniref:hypothetical protein n=1 Tax=Tissierella praeacuta TaxID=43131 RepID=UPI003DA61483
MWNKVFNRLPDSYSREGQVNNEKLHKVLYGELEEVKKVFEDIKVNRDMDNAKGRNLDYIGKNVLEYRITSDDELYRQLIKTKIIANLSQGDIETINEVARVLIGDAFQGVKETWNLSQYNNEPAGLVLTMKNQVKLLQTNAIDRAVAGGVGIKYLLELMQDKTVDSDIYIATVFVSGEEITVYPYSPKELSSKGNIYIATGSNAEVDTTTIYPRKEVI